MSLFSMTNADYSNEKTTTTINVAPDIAPADLLSLQNAVLGVTNGKLQQTQMSDITFYGTGRSNVPESRRERKILLTMQDNVTGRPFNRTIGCLLTSIVSEPDTDLVAFDPVGLSEVDVLAANINAHGRSPLGNPCTVLRMKLVGRNI